MRALTAWNVEAFVEAVHEKAPTLDWNAVFTCLDTPALDLPSADSLTLLMTVHRLALRAPMPVRCLLGHWKNEAAQLSAITHLLTSEIRNASDLDWTQARRIDEAVPAPAKAEHSCWLCLDLTSALLRLSARGFYDSCKPLFAEALSAAPQQLLAALVQTAPAGASTETALQAEMLESLLPSLISGADSANAQALLKRMWELQPAAVMRGMAQLHAAQPQSLLRLLDLAQSFNALEEILRLPSYAFTLDLAVVAQRKDLIALEPWASQQLAKCAAASPAQAAGFASALCEYIREKLLGDKAAKGSGVGMGSGSSSSTVNVLSAEYAAVFFRVLTHASLPGGLGDEVSALFKQCAQAKPKLQTLFNPDAPKPQAETPADVSDPSGAAAAVAAAVGGVPGLGSVPNADQLVPPSSPGLAASVGGGDAGVAALAAGFATGGNAGPAPLPGMPPAEGIGPMRSRIIASALSRASCDWAWTWRWRGRSSVDVSPGGL